MTLGKEREKKEQAGKRLNNRKSTVYLIYDTVNKIEGLPKADESGGKRKLVRDVERGFEAFIRLWSGEARQYSRHDGSMQNRNAPVYTSCLSSLSRAEKESFSAYPKRATPSQFFHRKPSRYIRDREETSPSLGEFHSGKLVHECAHTIRLCRAPALARAHTHT